MKELYQWLQDLAVYLILVSAILQALPQESYQKYIRFFSGLVLIILLMTPLLRLTDMEDSFRSRDTGTEHGTGERFFFGRNPGEAGRRKGRDDPGDGRKRADRSGGDSDWR